jgi:hypothetical protein
MLTTAPAPADLTGEEAAKFDVTPIMGRATSWATSWGVRELRRSDILWGMKLGNFTQHHYCRPHRQPHRLAVV